MNKRELTTGFMLILLSGTVSHAAQAQTTSKDGTAPTPPEKQMQHHRGPKQLTLVGSAGADIKIWKPDLSTLPLTAKMDTITIPSTGVDNYHAIVAEKDWGDLKEAIVRYEYLRGKPSKRSPTRLSGSQKTDFEVVPAPIPRGHYRYYSDQEWGFLLRFRGNPVPNHPIVMATANGSEVKGVTDGEGLVRMHIPDDFPNVVEGERDKRGAELTVSAELVSEGITYQSMLSAEYRVNQQHWKSFEMGLLVVGLGMLAGGYIGRKKNNKGSK